MKGGEVNESTPVVEHTLTNIGATIMGRNMFGGGPGPWNTEQPWIGWWKDNPPFHHPVFVLTHYPREPLPLKGGTTFHFVTGGIHERWSGPGRRRVGRTWRWPGARRPATST